MRSAFSILELVVAILIMAISAAVVVPNWLEFQSESKLTSASMAVWSDVQSLQRYAARHSQPLTVNFPVGGSVLNVSPAVPSFGDGTGNLDYSERYTDVVVTAAPFLGSNSAIIDMRGRLTDSTTGTPISVSSSNVTLEYSGKAAYFNLVGPMNLYVYP